MHTVIPTSVIATIVLLATAAAQATDPNLRWHSLGGAAGMVETTNNDDGAVRHLIEFGNGRNTRLVAIGTFDVAGSTFATDAAQWDGQSWSALPRICETDIRTTLRVGSKILIGTAQSIRVWDGVYCDVFEDNVAGRLYSLGLFRDSLVAAGRFTAIGGVAAPSIARWNGETWIPLGLGVTGSRAITHVVEYNGRLIAAGNFETIGGVSAHQIAQWDGSTWSPLGAGVFGDTRHLTVYDNRLIVAGDNTGAGGSSVNRIAQWDGAAWSPLGGGVNDTVRSSFQHDGRLFVCGDFDMAGGVPALHVAAWDGTSWSATGLDDGSGYAVLMGSFRGDLIAARAEYTSSRVFMPVFRFDGQDWKPLSPGTGGGVHAFGAYNGQLALSGEFSLMGNERVRRVALFDGTRFTRLGAGIPSTGQNQVRAFVQFGSELVAAGDLDNIDGQPVQNIAAWNGTAWRNLAGGVHGEVLALAVYQGELIAGGNFLEAGIANAPYVAAFNGVFWRPMGSGFNEPVAALAVVNGTLYAGGDFSGIGPFTRIAQWNGAAWQPLGSGIPAGRVSALAGFQGRLIAGGSFTEAGSVLASRVAQWNGSAWSPLGSGVDGPVNALAVYNGELYVAGDFATAGGIPSRSIARWNGTAWSGLDGGVQGPKSPFPPQIAALGILGPNLYVGGAFVQVGTLVSPFMARWGPAEPHSPNADSQLAPHSHLR